MKNKFFMIAAAFVTFLCLCSCSLVSDDSVSEVGSAEFTMSPELARAIVANQQNDDFNEPYANEKESLLIEISLSGDYSDKKSLSIDLSDVHSEPKTEEEQNALAEKIMGQTIKFDSIPVGKTVKAEVTISLVTTFLADNIEDKRTLVKGSSEPVTIHEGNNSVTVQLDFIYKNFPFTFTLSVEKGSIDYSKCLGIYFYAIKSSSSIVDKLYTSFSSGDGTYSDFSNITSSLSDLPDFLGVASCFPNYNENYDSLKFTPLSEGKAECSGTIYLPADESVIFVAEVQFTSTTSSSGMISYLGHVSANNISDVRATAVTPVMTGNNVSLVLSKFALETQYALYKTEGQTQYMYFLSSSPSDIGMSVGTSTVNTFCFDEDGYFYTLKLIDESWYIQSNNPECASVKATVTYSGEGTVDVTTDTCSSPVIFVDRKTNVLYMAISSNGGGNTTVIQYPDLISSGATTNSVAYGFSTPDSSYEFYAGLPMTIYNGVVYAVIKKYQAPKKVIKVDLSNTSDVSEIDLSSDTDIASMLASAIITDLICQDESLYVLISDKNVSCSNNSYAFYSRGALIKYDLIAKSIEKYGWTDSSLPIENTYTYVARRTNAEEYPGVLWEDGDGNPVLAKADKIRQLETIDPTGSSSFNIYSPANAENSFYAPSKFIAIKPKKLVIADDGYAFYTDALGAWRVKNVNRVVTVDLDSFIFTCTNVGVNFSGNISTNLTNNNGSYFDYMSEEAKKVYNSQTKDEINGSIYCSGGSTGSSISWAGEGSLPAIRLDD